MPPTDFLRHPARWLELMSQYPRDGECCAQFAYNLCVRKADPAALPDADLSSLRVILNGAEPINARGVNRVPASLPRAGAPAAGGDSLLRLGGGYPGGVDALARPTAAHARTARCR
jgi:hypothetical protein